jgi:hypothetical protein
VTAAPSKREDLDGWLEYNRQRNRVKAAQVAHGGKDPDATMALRRRARGIWIRLHNGAHPICRVCGARAHIYHKDGNVLNNFPWNHDPLCRVHRGEMEKEHPRAA